MNIETTPRGFSLVKFVDAADRCCSLQDSSIASEACCWFGVSDLPGQSRQDVTRMHLTVEMTRRVGRGMRDALEGRQVERFTFTDRYGSECIIAPSTNPDAIISVGVTMAFGGEHGEPMQLSRGTIEKLMPFLLGFLAKGTISGEGGASELDDPVERVLDVKIPVSMLARTDMGETGVAAQDVIDAFMQLFDYYEGDITSSLGHDNATRMTSFARRIGHLDSARRE